MDALETVLSVILLVFIAAGITAGLFGADVPVEGDEAEGKGE